MQRFNRWRYGVCAKTMESFKIIGRFMHLVDRRVYCVSVVKIGDFMNKE